MYNPPGERDPQKGMDVVHPDLPTEIIASESRRAREGGLGRPLGLRADAILSYGERRGVEELAAFDFTLVRSRLVQQGLLSEEWADMAILEFRRYLALRLLSVEPVMMLSAVVDDVWHASILFTRLYADLCQRVFGHFLHHDPEMQPIGDPGAEWRVFEERYTAFFGTPGALWKAWQPLE
jgi:hypothetical protein